MNYQDGSFIKIRNITVSYFMPQHLLGKLKMKNCRIYGQVINPGLIYSKISWLDPDLNAKAKVTDPDPGVLSYNRGFVIGVNAGF
jgi:hypothetical protein